MSPYNWHFVKGWSDLGALTIIKGRGEEGKGKRGERGGGEGGVRKGGNRGKCRTLEYATKNH